MNNIVKCICGNYISPYESGSLNYLYPVCTTCYRRYFLFLEENNEYKLCELINTKAKVVKEEELK